MRKHTLFLCACMLTLIGNAQKHNLDSTLSVLQFQQDSTLHATMHADSAKVKKEYAMKIKIAKFRAKQIFPVINAGDGSGVAPVENPTEVPDPTMDYKLLFEIASSNPDSIVKEINAGLLEVARVINLHVAAGVPVKKIFPVIVFHGGGIKVVTNNTYYNTHFKIDNPNIKLINELAALGARFIVCGQSMTFGEISRDSFLPPVKISLTAQTVLSSYQLKGYVKYKPE
jgi:intracellular sulfur oxidation DsrE/DsrF family protein